MSTIDQHTNDGRAVADRPTQPASPCPLPDWRSGQVSDTTVLTALVTVRDAHHAVCDVRGVKYGRRRNRCGGMGRWRVRAAEQLRRSASLRQDASGRRVSTRPRQVWVLGITAALLMGYAAVVGVAVMSTDGLQTNPRLVEIGALGIVLVGALCLNAATVSARTERTGDPGDAGPARARRQ